MVRATLLRVKEGTGLGGSARDLGPRGGYPSKLKKEKRSWSALRPYRRHAARRFQVGKGKKETIRMDARPLFMIGCGRLADMHPQTLRMYERRGLVRPKRSLSKRAFIWRMSSG